MNSWTFWGAAICQDDKNQVDWSHLKRPGVVGSAMPSWRRLFKNLGSVTADVIILKAGTEGKSVKLAGLGWMSLGDCQVWIKTNFPSNRYGLIIDRLLMLD